VKRDLGRIGAAGGSGNKDYGGVKVRHEMTGAERFLSAQADRFAGANVKEKAAACSDRNGGVRVFRRGVWASSVNKRYGDRGKRKEGTR